MQLLSHSTLVFWSLKAAIGSSKGIDLAVVLIKLYSQTEGCVYTCVCVYVCVCVTQRANSKVPVTEYWPKNEQNICRKEENYLSYQK